MNNNKYQNRTTVFRCSHPQHKTRNLFLISVIICSLWLTSCKKVIEVDPPFTSLNTGNVFSTDATAAAVLTNIYAEMSQQNINQQSQYITSISLYAGLAADELVLFNPNLVNLLDYYRNNLNQNTTQPNFWNAIYPQIFALNNAIEGLEASKTLNLIVKKQLLGEAKFTRGFCYFYLAEMFGDVPLVTNVDWKANQSMARTSKDKVYQQIVKDLKEAQELLSEKYLKGDAFTSYSLGADERIRPNKWVATALLARAYLFIGEWANAESESSKVISNSGLFALETLTNTFKKNNKESIWQLQPVSNNNNSNTGEGKLFILPSGGPNTSGYPVYLSNSLVNIFEPNDQRKSNWIDSAKPSSTAYYFSKKYKIGDVNTGSQEYPIILRLAEQYLIRAEARTRLNKIAEARDDLFALRRRAGLSDATLAANDQTSLLTAILHERQVELFTEWGHRWFDLKRTNTIDVVMGPVAIQKGGTWSPYKALYPIPIAELQLAPQLVQNPGYQ